MRIEIVDLCIWCIYYAGKQPKLIMQGSKCPTLPSVLSLISRWCTKGPKGSLRRRRPLCHALCLTKSSGRKHSILETFSTQATKHVQPCMVTSTADSKRSKRSCRKNASLSMPSRHVVTLGTSISSSTVLTPTCVSSLTQQQSLSLKMCGWTNRFHKAARAHQPQRQRVDPALHQPVHQLAAAALTQPYHWTVPSPHWRVTEKEEGDTGNSDAYTHKQRHSVRLLMWKMRCRGTWLKMRRR